MKSQIPPLQDIRQRLQALRFVDLEAVAQRSGVGFGTLMKIRTGQTPNPGIETVRTFIAHLPAAPRVKRARRSRPPTEATQQV